LGNVAERIIDGETGFVTSDDESFIRAAVALLSDDALWRSQCDAAWAKQRGLTWDAAAAQFEKLIS
jgi:glycosyltransferase involved in cell wall biosynthesis